MWFSVMSKAVEKKVSQGAGKPKKAARKHLVFVGKTSVKATEKAKGVRLFKVGKVRVHAVMKAAEKSGWLRDKSGRIGGRVSAVLIEQAKKQTGIDGDTDLIEFALANVALTDDFPKVFKESRGKVDPALKLGF